MSDHTTAGTHHCLYLHGDKVRTILKKLLISLLGDYEIYWIYRKALVPDNLIAALPDVVSCKRLYEADLDDAAAIFSRQKNYLGEQAVGYGLYVDDILVSACFYWFGERYKQRNFISLPDAAAKLVQIITAPEQQGKGYAAMLLSHSAERMQQQGFKQLYARVWHNNHPSNAIFRKKQWQRLHLRVRVYPLGRSLIFTLPF